MRRVFFLTTALAAASIAVGPAAAQSGQPSVLMISVDGLRPDLVLDGAGEGAGLPNLRGLFAEGGAFAAGGMTSVTPSLTYPNHQALVTGTNPATNGVAGNAVWDPEGVHDGAWNWWAGDAVPTLWEVAGAAGYTVASVGFPTSGGVGMDINIPDFWRDGTVLDDEILNMVSNPPGIVRRMLEETGISGYPGDAFDLEADRKRHRGMLWALENVVAPEGRPFLFTGYYSSYDDAAHENGVMSPEALKTAAAIDAMIGELVAAAREIAGEALVPVVVSDHGFLDIGRQVRPNVRLREAGLIETDAEGAVTGWRAFFQRAGGMGQIRLADPGNAEARETLEAVLSEMAEDPESGVARVLRGEDIAALKSFPDADYVLVMADGVEPRDEVMGEYEAPEPSQAATHGFVSDLPAMKASLFMAGPGLPQGALPDNARTIDVAPTLAALMGLELPDAEGRSLLD